MATLSDWTPDDSPAEIIRLSGDVHDWVQLAAYYSTPTSAGPLTRIFEIARAHNVVCVVRERRYVDVDYRSEHSRFYSTTFRRFPSVCHRLHFFTEQIADDFRDLSAFQDAYCGYTVLRPLDFAPVGRTMVAPPAELTGVDAAVCTARDLVHLMGYELTIDAAPFISQDAQYLRCAHAAQWMVLYHAHLRYGLSRCLPSDIHDASVGGVVVGRELPSVGLSQQQMLASLHRLRLSPTSIALPQARDESAGAGGLSLPALLSRYVNSGLPPIVNSTSHAWVVVGYRVEGEGHDGIIFYRNDDAMGPYIRVPDPWQEPLPSHRPWQNAIPPLPQKAFITAEKAESLGEAWIAAFAHSVGGEVASKAASGGLSLRTFLLGANEYRSSMERRALPPQVSQLYRFSQWPRFVWVVEAQDRERRSAGQPCVLGEVVIDATAHQYSLQREDAMLSIHLAGTAASVGPDYRGTTLVDATSEFEPYRTGAPALSHTLS